MKKHSGKYLLAMVSLGVLLGTSEVSAYVIYNNWPGGYQNWNQPYYNPVRGGRVYYYGPSYYNRYYPYSYRNPYTYRYPYSYGYRYPYNYQYNYNYPRATTNCPLVTGYFDGAGIWHPPYRACINN